MKYFTGFVMLVFMFTIMIALNIKYLKPFNRENYTKAEPRPFGVLDQRLRCKVPFHDILLVIVYNSPFYQNNKYLRRMYNDVFSKVVFCGPVKNAPKTNETVDIVTPHLKGFFGYQCTALAMQQYPGYKGYMSGADDMIINWWTLLKFDKSKIWNGAPLEVLEGTVYGNETGPTWWYWWQTEYGIRAYRKFFAEVNQLSKHSHIYEKFVNKSLLNGNGTHRCIFGWSDFFYIPSQFCDRFILLSKLAFKHQVFLEIAVHSITALLEDRNKFENPIGTYNPEIVSLSTYEKEFWKTYNWNLTFIHPFKMNIGVPSSIQIDYLEAKVIQHTEDLLKNRCWHINQNS